MQKLDIQHRSEGGNPAGGHVHGIGIEIHFQNGPMGIVGANRIGQNGAFVEDLINSAISRLEFYQKSKFKSEHNEEAIKGLQVALKALNERSKDREERGVEGTHKV